jgi:hypothetical protein
MPLCQRLKSLAPSSGGHGCGNAGPRRGAADELLGVEEEGACLWVERSVMGDKRGWTPVRGDGT